MNFNQPKNYVENNHMFSSMVNTILSNKIKMENSKQVLLSELWLTKNNSTYKNSVHKSARRASHLNSDGFYPHESQNVKSSQEKKILQKSKFSRSKEASNNLEQTTYRKSQQFIPNNEAIKQIGLSRRKSALF